MIAQVLTQLKSFQPQNLKALRHTLARENLRKYAQQAVESAKAFSLEETKVLTGKLEVLGQEAEKITTRVVNKLTENTEVTPEIKAEIVRHLLEIQLSSSALKGKALEVNAFVQAVLPRSVQDLKSLRQTVALKLVAQAQQRLQSQAAAAAPASDVHPTSA